jgi:hypothetical protein
MTDILDTYKPLFAAVTSIALTTAAVDSGGFPNSTQWFVAFGVGASTAALWHFGVTLFLSSFPLLPNANWETPPSPPEPLESAQEPQSEARRVDNQPVRQEARTGQPVALGGKPSHMPQRESMPMGVVKVIEALGSGELVPPFSLNKFDKIGVSRFVPKDKSAAEVTLDWFRSRGIIDAHNNLVGRLPSVNELPYPIDLSE